MKAFLYIRVALPDDPEKLFFSTTAPAARLGAGPDGFEASVLGGTSAAFKIYDVGIKTGVILNRAKMAVEHIADLGRYRLSSRDGIV